MPVVSVLAKLFYHLPLPQYSGCHPNLVRYDPFRKMLSLREAANRLFERSFVFPTWNITNTTLAPIDVVENEQGYQVKVQLPGMKPEEKLFRLTLV